MRDAASANLRRLFRPSSIALVGASERSIWSIAAVDNLKRCGFKGPVHMVNPKGGTIFGRTAAVSCAAIGETVDAALLMVPEARLLEAFDDLRAAGVGGTVILSAGFAETGAAGRVRQEELTQAARRSGIRILGPNCLGFANFSADVALWTTPLRRATRPATIAIASQSGALASQLEQYAYQQRVGLTHMISTGNEADLSLAEAVEFLAEQPEPRALALFMESARDPERFVRAAARARDAGKQVVVLKVGSSEASARAALAHTGSLVGNDRVFDAMCRRHGISRVRSLEELIVTADVASRVRRPNTPGLALVAMSGGMCEVATDQAEVEGVQLAQLSASTLAALRETLPPLATPGNPLDLTGAAMLEPELITRALGVLSQDAAVGALGFVFDVPIKLDERGFAKTFVSKVAEGFAAVPDKSCLLMSHTAVMVSAEGRALVDELGVAYTGAGVRVALSAIAQLQRPPHQVTEAKRPPSTASPRPHSEREVLEHLAQHGVPIVPAIVATDADHAAAAAERLGGPVVLKIASPDIQHKTEVGGVLLNLVGAEAVRNGYAELVARVAAQRPEAKLDGVIVSPMRRGGIELFVGTMRDPQWGPAIAVGLGGVFVEAMKDTSLRLLPVTQDEVLVMLDELRGSTLLDGFRGAPAADRNAIARAVVAIGEAALALGPELVSLEVNPLLAGGVAEALDGVVVWEAHHEHA